MELVIREERAEELDATTQILVDCWRINYSGMVEHKFLDGIEANKWLVQRKTHFEEHPGLSFVAELDGKIVGVCEGNPPRDQRFSLDGELWALYVSPSCQRGGVGSALLSRIRDELRARGYKRMMVKTLASNAQGRAFYRKMGGLEAGHAAFDLGGQNYAVIYFIYDLTNGA